MQGIASTPFAEAMAACVSGGFRERPPVGQTLDLGGADTAINFAPFVRTVAGPPKIATQRANARRGGTLGILGMGRIGQSVALRAHIGLGLDIVYSGSFRVPEVEARCAAQFVPVASLVGNSDFVCVILPIDREIVDSIGQREIQLLPPERVFLAWRRSQAIERALAYLATNYAEQIRIADLAHVACLSKYHFLRQFTATIGVTPHRYQLLLRIFHAKSILRAGMPIRDAALIVGFADQSHLHRFFCHVVGITPGQYQKRDAV